jgi:hypothetical protein
MAADMAPNRSVVIPNRNKVAGSFTCQNGSLKDADAATWNQISLSE